MTFTPAHEMRPYRLALLAIAELTTTAPLRGQNPWTKVPPNPTSCYEDGTPGFSDQVSSIRHDVFTEKDRQNVINAELRQRLNNMDMMEKQSKMLAFMQRNPTDAGKVMQDIAMAGQQTPEGLERITSRRKALDDQLKAAESQYAQDDALLGGIHRKVNENAPAPGSPGNPVLFRQYTQEYNAQYERVCAKWLMSAASPLLKYLSDFKRFLQDEQVPTHLETARVAKVELDLYGIPSANYKPTFAHDAVVEYLDAMRKVFTRRQAAPLRAG